MTARNKKIASVFVAITSFSAFPAGYASEIQYSNKNRVQYTSNSAIKSDNKPQIINKDTAKKDIQTWIQKKVINIKAQRMQPDNERS